MSVSLTMRRDSFSKRLQKYDLLIISNVYNTNFQYF